MTTHAHEALVPQWTFGDRIRKIRRHLGMTQGEFALSIDRGPKSIAAWELGTNTPGDAVAVAKRIQVAHGIPATWTLGLNEETPRPGGPDGGNEVVRPQGLEPRTRWFGISAGEGEVVPMFPGIGQRELQEAC